MVADAVKQHTKGIVMHIAAYYFPSWHASPLNERWHGNGWTEWDLVRSASARWTGHRQPITPAWGHFDDSDPAWAAREIDLAADHGLSAFLFDWYWYERGPFLHEALEQGFLQAPNHQRLTFALMWANHDWLNIFPAGERPPWPVLAHGAVDRPEFDRLADYIIEHYFAQPNYLRLDGGLYFSIYELGTFVSGLGGMDASRRALEALRNRTRRAGLGELHLNAVVWGLNVLPSEVRMNVPTQDVLRQLGVNSATTYAWVHHHSPSGENYPSSQYESALATNVREWKRYARELRVPYHPNVSMGWDPSPRTAQGIAHADRGYPWTGVFSGNTPQAFEAALRRARAFAEDLPAAQQMITVNAWNEWTEGSYLLPDTVHGTAFLEALRRALA